MVIFNFRMVKKRNLIFMFIWRPYTQWLWGPRTLHQMGNLPLSCIWSISIIQIWMNITNELTIGEVAKYGMQVRKAANKTPTAIFRTVNKFLYV